MHSTNTLFACDTPTAAQYFYHAWSLIKITCKFQDFVECSRIIKLMCDLSIQIKTSRFLCAFKFHPKMCAKAI